MQLAVTVRETMINAVMRSGRQTSDRCGRFFERAAPVTVLTLIGARPGKVNLGFGMALPSLFAAERPLNGPRAFGVGGTKGAGDRRHVQEVAVFSSRVGVGLGMRFPRDAEDVDRGSDGSHERNIDHGCSQKVFA
ncbi:hypothetical protein, partial [Streptomyces sp. NPDC101455]|uniref:hypothetical protein n=1 Tax=Streptomyces sp. NPDC101455 TaxID=3366142 RepID=UPI00381DA584